MVKFLSSDYDNNVMTAAIDNRESVATTMTMPTIIITKILTKTTKRWTVKTKQRTMTTKLSVTSAGYHDNWLRKMSMRRGFPFQRERLLTSILSEKRNARE